MKHLWIIVLSCGLGHAGFAETSRNGLPKVRAQADAEPTVKWTYATSGAGIYYSSPVIGTDGTIYVGNGALGSRAPDCGLFAINSDGSLKWKYVAQDMEAVGTPVVGGDGTIYVQDRASRLYAVRPDGILKWSYVLNTVYNIGAPCPAIAADGTIYVGADRLYALNSDGTLQWSYRGQSPQGVLIRGGPAIAPDGTVYVGANGMFGDIGVNSGNALLALKPDGTLKWECILAGADWIFSSPAIGRDGTVYLGTEVATRAQSEISYLFAVRPDGTLRWRYGVPGWRGIRASPVLGTDGTIYFGIKASATARAEFIALNPDGSVKWRFPMEQDETDLYSSAAVGADGRIYFGYENGQLHALNPDGSLAWRFQTNNGINWPSPAIDRQGTIYIGNNNGVLFALKTGSYGLAESPWPKHRQNNLNTGRQPADVPPLPGAAGRVLNISTRGRVEAGANILISGFIITGARAKTVLIRAVGPALAPLGVTGALAAPVLTLFDDNRQPFAQNAGWSTAPNAAAIEATSSQVGAFGLSPGSGDSALLVTLGQGNYTAQVGGTGSSAGVALVEVYDAGGRADDEARITNISTRCVVGTGSDQMIAGFVISGALVRRVLIRAVGPSLAMFGLTGLIEAPQVKLFDGQGALQQTRGAWSAQADVIQVRTATQLAGAFPLTDGSKDVSFVTTLVPGAWTVQVAGANNTTGIALVEVYDLP